MLTIFLLLTKIYLLVRLIDDPTPQNYLLFTISLNLLFFGYTWTLYMTTICIGLLIIDDKKMVIQMFENSKQKIPQIQLLVNLYRGRTVQLLVQNIKYNGDQIVLFGHWVYNLIIRSKNAHIEKTLVQEIIKKIL